MEEKNRHIEVIFIQILGKKIICSKKNVILKLLLENPNHITIVNIIIKTDIEF